MADDEGGWGMRVEGLKVEMKRSAKDVWTCYKLFNIAFLR